jgi:hypothetical protein
MRVTSGIATLALVCATAAVSTPASAQGAGTAGDLLRNCQPAVAQADGAEIPPEAFAPAVWCMGYVSGVNDAHALTT